VLQRLETAALEAPGDDLAAFADALAEYTLRRRREGGVEDLHAVLAETGEAIDDVLQRTLGAALAPFQARGLEVRHSSAGRSLLADDDGDVGRRAEGLARLPGARVLAVPTTFTIGDGALRRLGLFVVPLQSLGGHRLAVIADVPGPAPLVLEGGDDLGSPRVRRWIEDVVGRVLADYVQSLY